MNRVTAVRNAGIVGIALVLLACSNPQPEETKPTPFLKVCIKDGVKVECPDER